MEWQVIVPAIIGSFVGVMGWLLVGIYIQRRQFMRQARNAAKAVYFELDVNRATIGVAREHGLFSELDRTSFERLLPELATLLPGPDLRTVVDAYMTHAGYRQLASQGDLPAEVRRAALGTFVDSHDHALATLRTRAFTPAEARAVDQQSGAASEASNASASGESVVRAKP